MLLPEVFGGVVNASEGSPDEPEVLMLGARAARAAAAAGLRAFALRVEDGLVLVLASDPAACGAGQYDYEL